MEHYTFDIFSCDQMNEFGLKIASRVPNGVVIGLLGAMFISYKKRKEDK